MPPTVTEKVAEVKAEQIGLKVRVRDLVEENQKTRRLVRRSFKLVLAALNDCKNSRPCMAKVPTPAQPDPMPKAWFETLGKLVAGALILGSVAAGAWQEYQKPVTPAPQVVVPQK